MNHYKSLKVSSDSTTAEIKSAYRKLARKKHPDLNDGDENAAREFARIAEAYKVLSNPEDRANYDKRRLKAEYGTSGSNSVFNSDNPHARRARQMAYERRYNAIIDRMIADQRREAMALQEIVFPVVSLFVSTGFVAVFKPLFWSNSTIVGKIILFTLFVVGILHLFKRFSNGFERYTYSNDEIHESLLEGFEEESRPYSRLMGVAFLVVGISLSFGIGLLAGNYLNIFTAEIMPRMFSHNLRFEFVFYPPIAALLVDTMHTIAMKFDY